MHRIWMPAIAGCLACGVEPETGAPGDTTVDAHNADPGPASGTRQVVETINCDGPQTTPIPSDAVFTREESLRVSQIRNWEGGGWDHGVGGSFTSEGRLEVQCAWAGNYTVDIMLAR